ncbi:sialate O-acetylesterase [Spirosoma endbachense]|uniref:Sialate O-acetylesterase domain-containing protein n=1 Tax=Spirosoma endbachense TaxID=2666025 RepID=A0A6P1W6X3_9BACT|nr:sialate O-acetylesterase [Spirosoma endbachense]QHW00113.1 hypothetical protein GJR95_36100 [Spirosoma endbachense]
MKSFLYKSFFVFGSLMLAGKIVRAQQRLFLLAGQSNAVGQGDSRTSAKYQCPTCFDYNAKKDSLSVLKDPVGQDDQYFNKANTGSIAPALATTLHKLTGDSIVIVSAARGGSSCHQKAELKAYGSWAETGRLLLFAPTIEKIKKAERRVKHRVDGIIWMQGERDANTINDKLMTADEYETALTTLIARFRTELGANLPFFIVLTGYYANHPREGYDEVRRIQRKVARQVPGVQLISVDPGQFPDKDWMTDEIHYSQAGLNKVGEAVANQITSQKK